ncbi:putative spermidine/putrescine transport system substrate-binding protein [Geosporobacter subterraneus DSM 17957]|uniref:Putative spermidine/putrescine transport system substrate-binding protein n=1 Tax=Geosporobacter subterraneus DSM 17957 TaxID=1121919 RepID=A0A1M6BWR1_9FIRM|nr:ABC transporter substrate-binding protein [Geosporobacter subterraneus]SHI53222.1 putative spermidine/putrescine transport system substrate-binding protein [Geosporobacter subterraneus DSM 17957]
MKKRILIFLLIGLLSISIIGCSSKVSTPVSKDVLDMEWSEVESAAKGSVVNFYGWGGDEKVNRWLDTVIAPALKDNYDITLNRVPMNAEDFLNKLLGDKQVGNEKGSIDVLWINGENFYTAKNNELLFGPFLDKLPNAQKYINLDEEDVKYDFGYPVEGYEAPYGKAQLVFIYDRAKIDAPPKNHIELLELAKKYPGKITYPAPPDFTGSAFVRNIIYDVCGYETFQTLEDGALENNVAPGMDYLRELKPYLWRKGETYPATVAQLNNMFADGEVLFGMSYTPYYASGRITDGEFSETTDTFVFDKGNIGNTHFLAIPFNAQNKAGAMVTINYIEGFEAQISKYNPEQWGDLPVLDYNKLSQEEKQVFDSIPLGKGGIPQNILMEHRVPEMPARFIPRIEEIWVQVLSKKGE